MPREQAPISYCGPRCVAGYRGELMALCVSCVFLGFLLGCGLALLHRNSAAALLCGLCALPAAIAGCCAARRLLMASAPSVGAGVAA